MKEKIITLQTAKLATEKGYDDTFVEFEGVPEAYYNEVYDRRIYTYSQLNGTDKVHLILPFLSRARRLNYNFLYHAPSQELLRKWLRDEHNISIIIDDFINSGRIRYDHKVKDLGSQDVDSCEEPYETYEEALEDALKVGLRLIEKDK